MPRSSLSLVCGARNPAKMFRVAARPSAGTCVPNARLKLASESADVSARHEENATKSIHTVQGGLP
eukprot:7578450-Alexandrium_andersonii.AAC.1